MPYAIKAFIILFLLAWVGLGAYLFANYDRYFGRHPDDPSQSSGAAALNVTQVGGVWFGFFALALHFLFA